MMVELHAHIARCCREAYENGYAAGFKSKSPCACRGEEVLARFTTDIVVGILDVHVPDGCPDGRVRVLVFDAEEAQ